MFVLAFVSLTMQKSMRIKIIPNLTGLKMDIFKICKFLLKNSFLHTVSYFFNINKIKFMLIVWEIANLYEIVWLSWHVSGLH